MKTALPIWAALALLTALLVATPAGATPPAAQSASEHIVVLHDGADPARVAADHEAIPRHLYQWALQGFAAKLSGDQLSALRADSRVMRVEEVTAQTIVCHNAFHPCDGGGTEETIPTGIDRVDADLNPKWAGSDVAYDVAIIDTGIDRDHPDLDVRGGRNFTGGSTSNWDDGNGHGTHVAGTVGAIDNDEGVVGVAPGVRLWAAKACKNGGICLTSELVAAIDWVTEQKKTGTIDFAAANYSISTADDATPCGPDSDAVHLAMCGAVDAGIVFNIAAGNDNREKEAYPEVTAVSALADFDGLGGGAGSPTCRSDEDDTLANFSNFGDTVDIAAPGVCILSTWNDGGYNTISGTSMATPHMTGAVAFYLHANGLPTAKDAAGVQAIEDAIYQAAHPEGTATEACSYDHEFGSYSPKEPLLFVNHANFGGDGSCEST